MRTVLSALVLAGITLAGATAVSGCVSNSPDDCASRHNCPPPSADASSAGDTADVGADLTMADVADVADTGTGQDGADSTDAEVAEGAVDVSVEAAGDGAGDAGDATSADAKADAMDAGDGFDGFVCDPTKSPKDAPCVVDSAYGVFVSPAGRDVATGTMSDPVRTITEGIAQAVQMAKGRVYVCQGSYAEQVTLDAQHDGVSLYGGLDCAGGWSYTGIKAQVRGPSALYALRVDATGKPIVIEDMGFAVPDAVGQDDAGEGHSSIAAFVSSEAAGVTLRRVALTAGKGVDGASGPAPATNLYSPDGGDLQGNGAIGAMGGAAKDCPCKAWGDTQGGAGGNAGFPNAGDGGAGTATPTTTPGIRNGAGGAGQMMTISCTGGTLGADGMPRRDAGAGGVALGTVGATGWLATAGTGGLAGNPGQGGGGGGGGPVSGAGGGGCGGCGGAGGIAGQAGGGSIALMTFNAVIQLEGATITTGLAGSAGSASTGESGGGGGGGSIGACSGGFGGNGGGGQGGGGGAGGVSVGILSNAASRIVVSPTTTFALGRAGTGGTPGGGGQGGSNVFGQAPAGSPGTKGIDGISQPLLSP